MWMMGYSDSGDFSMPDSFNSRRLRPLMPRPLTSSAASPNPSCALARIHGNDFVAFNHHLGTSLVFLQCNPVFIYTYIHNGWVCLFSSYGGGAKQEGIQYAPSCGELEVESDAGAATDPGGVVQAGNENAVRRSNPTHHRAAPQVREDRREERVLLVSESQSAGAPKTSPPTRVRRSWWRRHR